MKALLFQLALCVFLSFCSFSSYGQCDINLGCSETPILSIDPPIFDATTSTLILNNVTFGQINCTATTYKSGIILYIYQLLPNGDRISECNFAYPPPFNVLGILGFDFGQTSLCGATDGSLNIGTYLIGPEDNFEVCDGALLEIEAVLYITDNVSFEPFTESVYTVLSSNEFISIDLGTVDVNINNEFPGGGQPLTSAVINEFSTGSDGPLTVNCGDNIELYVEGLSRIANCLPYDDISTFFPSESTNILSYTINGGAPIILSDPSSGAAGGQLTGPDPALNDLCYGGILTSPDDPFIFEWSDLPNDLCEGSTLVFTISTTDIFTGVTVLDDITIIYSGTNCNDCDMQGCTDNAACNFDATATTDDGSCLYNDCEGTCGGAAIAGTACLDANGNAGNYTDDCICSTCEEEITGAVRAADDCDVSGIDITIFAPDGTSINVTTESDGSFSVPGGPFPCGVYTAAFFNPDQLPYCYTETGSVDPITFLLDGNDLEENDFEFAANPDIPTLSQWGMIILVLLLMSVGSIKLVLSIGTKSTN